METQQERDERIHRLEEDRARRQNEAGAVWPIPDDPGSGVNPVQIAPGRGDLNYTAGFVPTFPTALAMINRTVSFARLFQSQPWVAAAVMRMMSWAIRVPLKAYRDTGDKNGAVELEPGDHPIADAIVTPWDRGNRAQFVMAALGPVLVNGNSVMAVDEGRSGKLQFRPQDWRFTQPIMPFRDSIEGFNFNVDSYDYMETASIDEVLHIAWWSPIGPIGTSPLQQLGVTLNIEDAIQRYQIALMRNGARPPSAITASDAFLGLERAERQVIMNNLREDVSAIYGGPDNSGIPALLPPGLDWKNTGMDTVEAELINQRELTKLEVAAVYQILPPMLGIMDNANYSNLQATREMTYTDTLGPPLILIEDAINAQIIRNLLQLDDIFVRFDFSAVLRGDVLQEIAWLRDAIATGLYTPNEGREVLKLQRSTVEGMDQFYMPVNNLQPIGSPPVPGPSGQPAQQPPGPQPPQRPEQSKLHYIEHGREFDLRMTFTPPELHDTLTVDVGGETSITVEDFYPKHTAGDLVLIDVGDSDLILVGGLPGYDPDQPLIDAHGNRLAYSAALTCDDAGNVYLRSP